MSTQTPSSYRQTLQQGLQPVRAAWAGMSPRERRMLQVAGLVLFLALCWLIAVRPALRTLREAPVQRAAQEQQLARMRQWQAEARPLQQQSRISASESQHVLQEVSDRLLGPQSLTLQGTQAQARLQNVKPEALAQWLQQVRTLARAVPQQAQIERTPTGWNGTVVLRLPS